MAFKDNRQFIEALEKSGDVVRIKQEVDWELEAAAIARRSNEMQGPACLFEKIKDYPEGFRIFSGGIASYRRLAIALGLSPDIPVRDMFAEYERREQHPIKPVVVKDGPCKENIMLGDDIDLFQFPTPLIHDGDGGRYLGTWDIIINKDPDSDWTNWGTYRFMVHNRRALVGQPLPLSHLTMLLTQKYAPANKPMPVAIVIGADQLSTLVGGAGYRIGENEADFAGALAQEPIELIKCETSDLLVPAHAEIVIEGEILPHVTQMEGPFGEYTGYRSRPGGDGVICRVKAITYRNSPMITMVSLGIPVDEGTVSGAITMAMTYKRRLKRMGLPITDISLPLEGACHVVVVGVTKGGNDIAQQVRDAITSRRVPITKLIVVDKDIDVFNFSEVLHAIGTRCHSARGIMIKEHPGRGNPLTPCYSTEERTHGLGATALLDCTYPLDWPENDLPVKSSFNTIYPESVRQKVMENWQRYGFR